MRHEAPPAPQATPLFGSSFDFHGSKYFPPKKSPPRILDQNRHFSSGNPPLLFLRFTLLLSIMPACIPRAVVGCPHPLAGFAFQRPHCRPGPSVEINLPSAVNVLPRIIGFLRKLTVHWAGRVRPTWASVRSCTPFTPPRAPPPFYFT